MNLPKNTDLRLFNVFCILTSVFCFLSFAASAQAKYGGGSGSEADPYIIFTASQMNQIGLFANETDWDKNFKLMADIDLGAYTGTSFNIIGYDQYYDSAFNGVFDGNGHTIDRKSVV